MTKPFANFAANRFLLALYVFLFSALATASPSLAQKSFVRDDLASEAVRLEETLRKDAATLSGLTQGRSVAELKRDAAIQFGKKEPITAIRLLGAAVAAAPKDAVN